jgi:adenylosuccinate lyase
MSQPVTDPAVTLYRSPLSGRYASEAMRRLFSDLHRAQAWRRIWIELARATHELGGPVSGAQVAALEAHANLTDADITAARDREREVRHDVMAHVHAFGLAAPEAKGIIHLGATSCDVTDNGDLMILRDALRVIHARLVGVLRQLGEFCERWADTPTLGFTHYQPAMPTTVGKRAAMWAQDLLDDARAVERTIAELPFRGLRGATGTQASFLTVFNGDAGKVVELERRVADALGFSRVVPLTGQTYPRKLDATLLAPLTGLSISAAKFANDMRLLANLRELEEPFGARQIGSSAMPFKRNPMRCERLNALARSLAAVVPNAVATAQAQWLERTLDDSANRRLTLSEAFLLADSLLLLLADVTGGIVVNEAVIRANLNRELPFLASEPILMAAVVAGGDRQELHEALRTHTHAAVTALKAGLDHDLVDRLRADPGFAAVDLDALLDPANPIHIGRAPAQTRAFLADELRPWLERHAEIAPPEGAVTV